MERGKKKIRKADLIFTADMHLTDKQPATRTDDYIHAQTEKLVFLSALQQEYNCPVVDAGDIFDHWKASPWLIQRAYNYLPDSMFTIPGNHDLPEHSMEQYNKSALSVLEEVGKLECCPNPKACKEHVLYAPFEKVNSYIYFIGIPYGEDMDGISLPIVSFVKRGRRILIIHEMVWESKTAPWPGAEGGSGLRLLKKYHDKFDVILTGHNHTGFTLEYEDSILVNPGSMMRNSVDKADYRPRCYLYYADTNTVEPAYYPIKSNVHNLEAGQVKKDRDERVAAYIERMDLGWEAELSFEGNLRSYFQENKTSKKVEELIWQSLEKV